MRHVAEIGECCRCNACEHKRHIEFRQIAFYILFAMPLGFALLIDATLPKGALFVAFTLINSWCLVWLCLKPDMQKVMA